MEQDEEERKRMSTGYHGPSADWTANASSISHIFVPTSNTGDSCYVNQDDCKHSGNLYNNKQECNGLCLEVLVHLMINQCIKFF